MNEKRDRSRPTEGGKKKGETERERDRETVRERERVTERGGRRGIFREKDFLMHPSLYVQCNQYIHFIVAA